MRKCSIGWKHMAMVLERSLKELIVNHRRRLSLLCGDSTRKSTPMYYWPQLLLEEMVKSANKRERERLLRIVGGLRDKTKLSRDLLKLLQNFNT